MKSLVYSLTFLFILFLSTPSLVACLGIDTDVSSFYEAAEEEETHNNSKSKEYKNHFKVEIPSSFYSFVTYKMKKAYYCVDVFHDTIYKEVVIPPPDHC